MPSARGTLGSVVQQAVLTAGCAGAWTTTPSGLCGRCAGSAGKLRQPMVTGGVREVGTTNPREQRGVGKRRGRWKARDLRCEGNGTDEDGGAQKWGRLWGVQRGHPLPKPGNRADTPHPKLGGTRLPQAIYPGGSAGVTATGALSGTVPAEILHCLPSWQQCQLGCCDSSRCPLQSALRTLIQRCIKSVPLFSSVGRATCSLSLSLSPSSSPSLLSLSLSCPLTASSWCSR